MSDIQRGLMCKPVDMGTPDTYAWQTAYVRWPWWAHVLLLFKRGKWIGDGPIECKIKVLFGTMYLLGVRMKKDGKP